ncbi:hypothetical protein F4859DRAFT_522188 [Xylaria cf. heliscus]|nr:hypothetical protein F4859DRAFT_522188 [Xylaria cf. heliscus]
MPPLDTESQFRFLISCIRHSSSGKVDFEEVRKECGIVSKGAAAKRYERIMKSHNITTGVAVNGIKNEAKDGDEAKKPKPRATKKRKLEEVNGDEDDIDEPIKSEPKVKGEVKYEDAIVKPEYPNDDPPTATPLHRPSSQSQSAPSPTNTRIDDDDDEVLFISATEKRSTPNIQGYGDDKRPPQTHSPMPATHGIQSVDYAANMSFPQQLAATQPSPQQQQSQLTPTMMTMTPSNSFSYGFAPATWAIPHNSHGYL